MAMVSLIKSNNIKVIISLLLLTCCCIEVKSQRFDKKDLSVYYSSGLFLKEEPLIEHDSIIVVNNGYNNQIDTSIVIVKKASTSIIEVTIYNTSLKKMQSFCAQNRLKEGGDKVYYPNGNIKTIDYYHQGQEISPNIGFYENGKLWFINGINNNNRRGQHIIYYEGGNIFSETYYVDTSQSPITMTYYESGSLKDKIWGWVDNENYYEYYENGILKTEGKIMKSTIFPKDKWIEYYQNGHIKSIKYFEFNIISSRPIGEWIFYDEAGGEIRKEMH